jgi:hypothetical protein
VTHRRSGERLFDEPSRLKGNLQRRSGARLGLAIGEAFAAYLDAESERHATQRQRKGDLEAGPRRSPVIGPMSGSLRTTPRPLTIAEAAVFTAARPRGLNRTNHDESRKRRGPGRDPPPGKSRRATGTPDGPQWVRRTPGTPGSRWARAVTTGIPNLQLDAPSRERPAPLEELNGGFESHLTAAAGWQPLPRTQVVGPERASPSCELVP